MTVICKVTVDEVRSFGEEKLVKTNCVAENEVMAMYNKDDEDKLFTQASPSGSADFVVSSYLPVPESAGWPHPKLYLVFLKAEEKPEFKNALFFAPVMVKSITDYGGTSKQVDITTYYGHGAPAEEAFKDRVDYARRFNHRIMIDNPGAFDQFKPGERGWWVAGYECEKHTMHEALADAHV